MPIYSISTEKSATKQKLQKLFNNDSINILEYSSTDDKNHIVKINKYFSDFTAALLAMELGQCYAVLKDDTESVDIKPNLKTKMKNIFRRR